MTWVHYPIRAIGSHRREAGPPFGAARHGGRTLRGRRVPVGRPDTGVGPCEGAGFRRGGPTRGSDPTTCGVPSRATGTGPDRTSARFRRGGPTRGRTLRGAGFRWGGPTRGSDPTSARGSVG